MPLVKLVTFDVTGTLLLFRTHPLNKYFETGLKFGIKSDIKTLEKNSKEAWRTLNKHYPNYGKNSNLDWQKWWAHYVIKTFEGYIKPEDNNKISEIVKDLIEFHLTKDAFIKQPGADDLLSYLKMRSIKMGIISNYDPRLHHILELVDLKKYFDFVLISYEFGHSKPDAEIFEEALRLGGYVSRDEVIHVGNDLELDYLSAKKVGFRAVLISSNEEDLKSSEVTRNEVFEDLFKLKAYFQELL